MRQAGMEVHETILLKVNAIQLFAAAAAQKRWKRRKGISLCCPTRSIPC
jgi:hypothetical protein